MGNGRKKDSCSCELEESAMFQKNIGEKNLYIIGMMDGQLVSQLHECQLMKQGN